MKNILFTFFAQHVFTVTKNNKTDNANFSELLNKRYLGILRERKFILPFINVAKTYHI